MKSNFFKYIFILFAIAILIFAVVKMKKDEYQKEEITYQVVEKEKEEIREIKLGIASFDSINPILSNNKNVQDVSKIIFEPLLTLTSDYKLENCLVKEWAKQNSKTYLITLRNDKLWSDGQKFKAEDVKFTIDRIRDSDSVYAENVKDISNIEVIDDTTIRIVLDNEVPFFEYKLTFPILSSSYYSDKEFASDIVPVGTGMYKVTEVQESALILERNENYKDKENLKLEKITVVIYSSIGELYNSFKLGSVDVISTQNNNVTDYIGTIGYTSKEMKGREHDFIALNTASQFLSETSVRKAILYSIDKQNIVSSIYEDKYYTSDFPLDYGNWVVKDNDIHSDFNPDEAEKILLDDGWEYKNNYWQKTIDYNTRRISLNFVVRQNDGAKLQVAENIKAQLENQGFRINLLRASDNQYQSYLDNKNYDMIICGINLSISPDLSTFFGQDNLSNYSEEEVTKMMNEVKNSRDEQKVKDDYKRLQEIYINDVPYISLYNNKYITAYNSNLVGNNDFNWYYQYYNIENWHK